LCAEDIEGGALSEPLMDGKGCAVMTVLTPRDRRDQAVPYGLLFWAIFVENHALAGVPPPITPTAEMV
jgi:hypothetical protein